MLSVCEPTLLNVSTLVDVDVMTVSLPTHDQLGDPGNHPRSRANSGGLQKQAPAQKEIHNGIGEEGHWESRSHKLPSNGANDGSDQGSQQARVEEGLESI